jgi:hypothetical protein
MGDWKVPTFTNSSAVVAREKTEKIHALTEKNVFTLFLRWFKEREKL